MGVRAAWACARALSVSQLREQPLRALATLLAIALGVALGTAVYLINTTALTQFLGSATGGGYLEAATNTMAGILDPTTGVLTQDISSIQSNIASTKTQITAKQTQVTQLQSNLTQQMAAADAAIYDLQQQASEMQDMFTAEQDSEMTGSL